MAKSKLLLSYSDISHSFYGIEGASGEYVISTQVHGNSVRIVTKKEMRRSQADAMVTKKNIALAVQTADCLPVLLYDPKRRIAGAIHAGWRGLLSGVIHNTLVVFTQLGSSVESIIVAVGPSIRVCCYEVAEDLTKKFLEQGYNGEKILQKRNGKWYLDLQEVVVEQIVSKGVKKNNIDVLPMCTKENDEYFSLRRGIKPGQRNISTITML